MATAIQTLPPAPLLLRGPLAETVALPRSCDFQARVGMPALSDGDGVTPCVLVLTRSADREIDDLSLQLAAAGIPLLRLDSDRCPGEPITYDCGRGTLFTAAGCFRPALTWLRYFQPSALALSGAARSVAYARDQWLSWPETILAAPGSVVVNRGGAPGRIEQLAHARAVGLRTPATVVTTAPAGAARCIPGDGDLLVKTLGEHFVEPVPGELIAIAPRRMSRADLAAEDTLEPAPVLVQELIPCARELRIYAAGDELIAFAVSRPGLEARWTEPHGHGAARVPVPHELVRPLRALGRRLGLDVAAFDLLDTADGAVFLEVNAACDWLWCEALAGCTPVSAAVRAHLSARFRHNVGTTTRSNGT